MSKRKQDVDDVNDDSEKKCKTDEPSDSSQKGSTFVVTVVNDSIQGMQEWTEEETILLKQAVDADAGQFNWDVIASSVPAKDINQVKAYVLSMVSQQQENQPSQSANVIKAPIEIWTNLAQKLTSDEDKAAAVCIPQLMVAAAAEPKNKQEPGCPNYSQIYLYLASLLKGETPTTLPPLESSVVLSLIQDIVKKIESSEVTGQIHFLATSYKNYERESSAREGRANDSVIDGPSSSTETAKRIPTDSGKRKVRDVVPKICLNKMSSDSVITSSGRVVRKRIQVISDDSEDEEEDKDQLETTNKENNTEKAKAKPTSINPFQIPAHLLSFRPVNRIRKPNKQ